MVVHLCQQVRDVVDLLGEGAWGRSIDRNFDYSRNILLPGIERDIPAHMSSLRTGIRRSSSNLPK